MQAKPPSAQHIYTDIAAGFTIAAQAVGGKGDLHKLWQDAVADRERVHGTISEDEKNLLLMVAMSAYGLANAAIDAARGPV